MSANNKKPAPQSSENDDDLLGVEKTNEEVKAPEAKAPKTKTAEQKKIEAAQGDKENKFLPKVSERGFYHVKMEKKAFNPATGEKLSRDYNQIYTVKEWRAFLKHGQSLGFTCTILWNPENYK